MEKRKIWKTNKEKSAISVSDYTKRKIVDEIISQEATHPKVSSKITYYSWFDYGKQLRIKDILIFS